MADSGIVSMSDPMIWFIASVTEDLTAQARKMLQLEEQVAQLQGKMASQQEALEALPSKCCV